MVDLAELLTQAKSHHGVGRLADAERLYRQILLAAPNHAETHYLLGTACHASGRAQESIAHLTQAVRLNPQHVAAHHYLGFVFEEMRAWDDAVANYQAALRLRPDDVEISQRLQRALAARNARGPLPRQQHNADDATAGLPRAAELHPGDVDALTSLDSLTSLGGAFERQGKFDEAVACFRRAIEVNADDFKAHYHLGTALAKRDALDEAEACFRRALALEPDDAESLASLSWILLRQERFDEAIAGYRRTLQLNPDLVVAHLELAMALKQQDKLDEAAACTRRALELQPKVAEAHFLHGSVLQRQGCFDEARAAYERAIALRPDEAAWQLSVISLCPLVFDGNAQIDRYRQNLLEQLDAFARREIKLDLPTLAASECRPAFELQFHGRNERPIREAFARLFRHLPAGECPPVDKGRPRLGFVVTDRHESIFLKSMAGVVERLDSARFELVVVGSKRGTALMQPNLRNPAIRLLPLPGSIDAAAEAIRQARFDLLYYWEVNTDSTNYFLPFLRLAPIQCTSWGVQVTSGIGQLDYYLSSDLVEPPDAQQHYSERLVLARTLLTYQRRLAPPASRKPRDYFGLSRRQHLYLCAQQLGKFQPDFDPILREILRRDPQGVLVIADERHSRFPANALRQRFAATMPDVTDRIVFLPFQPADDYRSLIVAADVLLDPLHFGGVNSTYDGFSLNQPIVTLPAGLQRGRYTLGCYRKMGLTDCVADSPSHYVEIALRLANDAAFRGSIVERIRRASPRLFDDQEAVSEHERLFTLLIEKARGNTS